MNINSAAQITHMSLFKANPIGVDWIKGILTINDRYDGEQMHDISSN